MFDPKYLESGEFYQRRYHNFSTLIIIPTFLLVLFVVLFSLFAKREIVVRATGQIVPDKSLAIIQSTSNSAVDTNYLSENKYVKKGETLVTFKNRQEMISKHLLDQQIDNATDRLQSLESYKESILTGRNVFEGSDKFGYDNLFNGYIAQVNALDHEFKQQNSDKLTADRQADAQIGVLNKAKKENQAQLSQYQAILNSIKNNTKVTNNAYQYIYDNFVIQQQNAQTTAEKNQIKQETIGNVQQQIDQLSNTNKSFETQIAGIVKNGPLSKDSTLDKIADLKQQQLANAQQEINTEKQKLDELNTKKSFNSEDNEDMIIKSPETGLIHLESIKSKVKYLPKGQTIAEIYPKLDKNTKLNVQYFVPAENIVGVKVGQAIRFIINQNVTKPMMLNGKIKEIGEVPLQTKQGSVYQCEAELSIPENDYRRIKYGLSGRVNTIKGSKTWFNYYKDILLGGRP